MLNCITHTFSLPIRKRCFVRWVAVVSLLLTTIVGVAQNNMFKINDEVYRLYVEAQNHRTEREGLVLANQMYQRAAELNDKKGMSVARSTILVHSSYPNNYNKEFFNRCWVKLRETAEKYGYWQYYYYGSNIVAGKYLDAGDFSKAMDFVKETQQFAMKRHHPYGIYTSYRQLGLLRRSMGQLSQAERNYKQSLEYGTANCKDQDMGVCYNDLCACAELGYDFNKMLRYAEGGILVSKTKTTRNSLKRYKALALFALQRYDDFQAVYDDIAKSDKNALNNLNSRLGMVINCFHSIMTERNIKKVEELSDSKHLDVSAWLVALAGCYKYMGMYEDAYKAVHMRYMSHLNNAHATTSEFVSSNETLFHGMVYAMEKEQEDLERVSLNLTNSRLKLEQSRLKVEKATQAESIARMDVENSHLIYQNKRFEASQLADSLSMLKTQREAREHKMQMHGIIMFILIATCLIVLAVISIAARLIRRYSMQVQNANKQLRRNNSELVLEYERAEHANASKTAFVRNMTKDIHDPLYAIIGAATLLGSKDYDCSEDEKLQLGNTINEKTAELLSIIDTTMEKTKE